MFISILKKTGLFLLISLLFSGFMGMRVDPLSESVGKVPHLSKDYPIQPVPFNQVHFTDKFWKPRIDKMFTVTLPHELAELKSTGRDKNFILAAETMATKADTANFCTKYPFDDTDLYKVIQGISYLLQIHPDAALKASMDSLINLIAAAQEPDGYLYTARTVNPLRTPDWSGSHRWEKVEKLSHELYCSGHLFQAAAANYVSTGDKKLLKVATRNADLLDSTFGWGKLEKYPGHPEVALGLVSLYRVTGKKKYLELAKFFLDVRGPGGNAYEQAQKKVVDQRKAVGHAVRAGYLYASMADVSALTGDSAYLHADNAIWKDIVSSQIYVTGGIGATSNGEAFGDPYQLPNMTAYNETCASIANVYFNQRMFLSHGEGKYYDVLERTLYNALLSGLSLKGDQFFYPNPLESSGQYQRSDWFGCSCCPTNLARFIPVVGSYFYATKGNEVFVNLYGANKAKIHLSDQTLRLEQKTDYPRSGDITIAVNPKKKADFQIKLRIPGWAVDRPIPSDLYTFEGKQKTTESYSISLNGKEIHPKLEEGYLVLQRTWKKGDSINLHLPMQVQVVHANPKVKDDQAKITLERGPLVYCLEGPDNPDDKVLNMIIDPQQSFKTDYQKQLLDGITVINGKGKTLRRTMDGGIKTNPVRFTAIPYYTWANRGGHEMTVWIPTEKSRARPTPAPTIAFESQVSSSRPTKDLKAVKDQLLPKNSNDHSVLYYHWWPKKDTLVWIEYQFNQPHTISSSKVYWYDDSQSGGGCKVPDKWELLYEKDGKWLPVKNIDEYGTKRDQTNKVSFKKVKTSALKMKIQLKKKYSTGIYEWAVE